MSTKVVAVIKEEYNNNSNVATRIIWDAADVNQSMRGFMDTGGLLKVDNLSNQEKTSSLYVYMFSYVTK